MKQEGLTWIGRRTGQFRYSANGNDQWLQPLSIYTAGEAIQRGHIVSIALPSDVSGSNRVMDLSLVNDDDVVVKTRTDRHIAACGIAMESAAAGDKIHVLASGRFRYQIGEAGEYVPPFADADRGRLLFVSHTPGELTYDRDSAILNSRNIIQVGFISNTADTAPAAGFVDIEIQFEGDKRGPVEHTQFEFPFGEPYQHAYQGGSSPVRVFAIGQSDLTVFSYNFNIARPIIPLPSSGEVGYNSWIAVYSNQHANIIILGPSNLPLSTTQESGDRLRYITRFAESVSYTALYPTGTTTPPQRWGNPAETTTNLYDDPSSDNYTPRIANDILGAIVGSPTITYLGADIGLQIAEVDLQNGPLQQEAIQALIAGQAPGGPIFVEWDEYLNPMLGDSSYNAQGSYQSSGKAVLADRRFPERNNVLGLLLSRTEREYTIDDTALFIRKGMYHAHYDAFTPGTEYFLGINGEITNQVSSIRYPDTITRVGVAKTSRQLLVDIGQPMTARVDGFPIGAIKPLPTGSVVPEYGFLVTGQDVLVEDYPDLRDKLLTIYPESEITVDDTTFRIPEVTNPVTGAPYQIKATSYGNEPTVGSSTGKTTYTTIFGGMVPSIDITDLSITGPQSAFHDLTVDRIYPRLFIDVPAIGWREIPSGFMTIGGSTYGFIWNVRYDDTAKTYHLETDIGSGAGIVYPGATPTPLNGQQARVVILKPDVFARYSDFDVDIASITIDEIDETSDFPISSRATIDYVNAGIATNSLIVRNSVILGDDVEGTDSVEINGSVVIQAGAGSDQVVTIDNETGQIRSGAPMSPLFSPGDEIEPGIFNTVDDETLVTRRYVEDHRSEVASSSYAVHGIRLGHNNGFDADTVDGSHIGRWGSPVPSEDSIPTIGAVSGNMEIGRSIELHNQSGDSSFAARIEVVGSSRVEMKGPGGTSRFVLGLGEQERIYLINNSGTLEVASSATPAMPTFLPDPDDDDKIDRVGDYSAIKAGEFKTVSSREFKDNIEQFTQSALSIINNVQVVTYTYKNSDELRVGFIAEDTPKILSGSDQSEMNISSTVGVLIRAVQELSVRNAELEQRLQSLERYVQERLR